MTIKVIKDECISHQKYTEFETIDSRFIVGKGELDYKILQVAKLINLPIWTRDIRFALDILLDNHLVIFTKNKKNYFIKPKTKIIPLFSDSITADALSRDRVIIP